jgi:hypothetical protein
MAVSFHMPARLEDAIVISICSTRCRKRLRPPLGNNLGFGQRPGANFASGSITPIREPASIQPPTPIVYPKPTPIFILSG